MQIDIEADILRSKQISQDEIEDLIKKKIKLFHGLLTREVALRIIAKETGLLKNEEMVCKLNEIEKGAKNLTFSANVKKIWPTVKYTSGKCSRVVEIDDGTATKPLVLWNQDVELANQLRLKDEIKIKGAYEKSSELHLGYSGSLEVVNKSELSDLTELTEGEVIHIRGYVTKIEGEDSFVVSGKAENGFSFIVSDGNSERRCIIFHGHGSDRAARLEAGDEVIIEGAKIFNDNIILEGSSKILSRRPKDMLIGNVVKLECKSEAELVVEIDQRQVNLDRENALKFMEVSANEDIGLSTIVELKKDRILNSRIAIRIKEQDGKIFIKN